MRADAVAAQLRALVPGGESVRADVEAIVSSVRARGDEALSEYAERFDGVAAGAPLRVAPEALASALAELDADAGTRTLLEPGVE